MKIGLLSNERLARGVNWSTLSDSLYREMESLEDCARLAPPCGVRRQIAELPSMLAEARKCDALFSMNGRTRPEPVFAAAALGARNAIKAVFYVDPWKHLLKKVQTVDKWMGNDLVFIPYREAFDELTARPGGGRYRYLPFAADTQVFRNRGLARDVDILWMGRREEALHREILAFSQRAGISYRFRENTGFIADPVELGQLVSRARYFVVTPPDAARTGGYSPLVMRYLEGLAAGCRLIGVLPSSGEFEKLLPRDSILEVSADGGNFAQRFEADQTNIQGWKAAATASQIVLTDHGWDSRAREIISQLKQIQRSDHHA